MRKLSLACAAVAAAVTVAVHAETLPPNAVIVTATRTAQTVDETLAAVTVVTRADIERSQANDVQELLRGLPGMDFSVSGGFGKSTSLYLRGTNPGQVLVLVDGVKVGSATLGTPTWQFMPLAEIERIEIVRGPRSSLYGSEAIGGVVQIFTRRGQGPLRAVTKAMAGSYHTNEVSTGLSAGPGDGWFNVHGGRFGTRGINARVPTASVNDPDRDGLDNRYASMRAGYRFARETETEVYATHADGNTEFDSGATSSNESDFRQDAGGVQLRGRVAAAWHSSLHAGLSRDNTYNFRSNNVPTPSRFDTLRRVQTWQNDFSLDPHQLLILGYDKQKELVTSTTAFARTARENEAWFTLYQVDLAPHSWQLSLRQDDNEQFGQHETGSVAYGYAVTAHERLFISHGTGFRAPTLTDLYNPGPTSPGDPSLQPEKAQSTELGVSGKSATSHWSSSFFHTRIENLITLVGSNFAPKNVSRATITGLELAGSTGVDAWEFGGNITLLDPRDDTTNKYLRRRSRYTSKFDIDRRIDRTRIGTTLLTQSARFDNDTNTVRLGGYTLLGLRVEQTLAPAWRLGARVENMLDKEYQTTAGFNSVGRAFFMTLSYQSPAQ